MELTVSIMVPDTVLNLCCRYTGVANPNEEKYRLNETDPDRFNDIIKTIKSASPNQFFIENRPQNDSFMRALNAYNKAHPDAQIDIIDDIIKNISVDNYKQSKIGTKGDHINDEMHEFANMRIPGFTKNSKSSLYVKFVTPEAGKKIDVISVHRPIDNKKRW